MITFSDVSKVFFNGQYGLRGVSFSIEPGELVLITGPSGSGKTTLMRLLTKESNPTEGEIVFENKPLSSIKNSQVHHHRRRIGVVFQDYRLLPELNVWENIALPLSIIGKHEDEIEQRVTDLLELVQLAEKADLFPSELSGGEAQRVGIARALATAPKVIFADEPTGNLDVDNSTTIAHLLKKINELGTTVLLATHDLSVIDFFNKHRHLELEKGTLKSDSRGAHKTKSSPDESKPTHAEPKPASKESAPHEKVTKEPEVEIESLEENSEKKKPTHQEKHPEKNQEKEPVKKTSKTRVALKLPSIALPFGKKKATTTSEDPVVNEEDLE